MYEGMSRKLQTFASSTAVGGTRDTILVSTHSYARCTRSRGRGRSVSFQVFSVSPVKICAEIENTAIVTGFLLGKNYKPIEIRRVNVMKFMRMK